MSNITSHVQVGALLQSIIRADFTADLSISNLSFIKSTMQEFQMRQNVEGTLKKKISFDYNDRHKL